MALLELDAEATKTLIADYPGVTVAVYAAPRQTVIAGPPEQVDAVIAAVDAQGRLARRVEVDVASHHPTVDPILPELRSALADLAPDAPKIPLISTVDQNDGAAPTFDADYWVANLRNPVRFSQAVSAAAANHANFVEMSPHPLLTYAIGDTLESTSATDVFVTSAIKRIDDETLFFHTQLAALGVMAAPDAGVGRFVDMPSSPWLHSKHWIAIPSPAQRLPDAHPLLGVHVELLSGRDHVWQADIGTATMPWQAGHKVHGQAVMSAAAFAEMALAGGCEALRLPVESVQVTELKIEQPFAVDHQTQVTTQLTQTDGRTRVDIHARSAGGSWSRYAVACVDAADDAAVNAPAGGSETDIVLPDEAADHPLYRIHPALLDEALQRLAAAVPAESGDGSAATAYLPVSVATVRVFGQVGRRARCRTELTAQQDGGYLGRVVLTDDTGIPTADLTGVELRPINPGTLRLPLGQKIFDTEWVESSDIGQAAKTSPRAAGSWLLLADDDGQRRDDGTRGGIHHPVQLVDPASDQRRVLRRVDSAGGFHQSLRRFRASAGRHHRVRRKAFV